MQKKSKILIAGSTGMVGSSILKILKKNNYDNLLFPSSKKLDLLDQKKVKTYFARHQPDYVFMSAGKVGGLYANISYPADFIYENSQMIINVIHFSHVYKVKKLLFFGSSCIYPKNLNLKIKENKILSGPMEETNLSYSISKIVGLQMCKSYNDQYKTKFVSIMPCNIYGPNDTFHIKHSHVIPSLIIKFHNAKIKKLKQIKIYGSGKVKREFLFVDDLAEASLFLMKKFNKNINLNVGSGFDISIKDLSFLIKKVIGYKGKILFDKLAEEGQKRKLLNVEAINKLGWRYKTDLITGIEKTYQFYKSETFN